MTDKVGEAGKAGGADEKVTNKPAVGKNPTETQVGNVVAAGKDATHKAGVDQPKQPDLSKITTVKDSDKDVSPAVSAAASGQIAPAAASGGSPRGPFGSASSQAANTIQPKIGDESAKHYGEQPKDAVPTTTGTSINPAPPIGAQLEPALMTLSGSLDHDHVATPTGSQPAAAVGNDELAKQAVTARNAAAVAGPRSHKTGRRRLSDEYVRKHSPAEIKAVATDRGYEGVEGGRQAVYDKFIEAQEDDSSLEDYGENDPAYKNAQGKNAEGKDSE